VPRSRPDLAALGFCALVVIAVTILALQGVDAPPFLTEVGLFVAGASAGVALNTHQAQPAPARVRSPLSERTVSSPRPAPSPFPAPAPAEPADSVPYPFLGYGDALDGSEGRR
jgi:hypothetical protein